MGIQQLYITFKIINLEDKEKVLKCNLVSFIVAITLHNQLSLDLKVGSVGVYY